MIDLHLHSTCSDGTDPPERIIELAAAAGCSAVALTDHDTFTGHAAAGRRAAELGVTLVHGCEVSCTLGHPGGSASQDGADSPGPSAHVLVYFVTGDDSPLAEELANLRGDRVTRNRRLVARLNELGIPLTYEEVVAEAAGETSTGRPHFAAVLVRHGAADSIPDAFDRWLATGRPAHVPKARITPAEVATLARASGGVAVLAHPLSMGLAPDVLAATIRELAELGFVGIEAIYGRYSPAERATLATLARDNGLVVTGGSDYHGTVKPDLSVGTGRGDLSVPDSALEELVAHRPS